MNHFEASIHLPISTSCFGKQAHTRHQVDTNARSGMWHGLATRHGRELCQEVFSSGGTRSSRSGACTVLHAMRQHDCFHFISRVIHVLYPLFSTVMTRMKSTFLSVHHRKNVTFGHLVEIFLKMATVHHLSSSSSLLSSCAVWQCDTTMMMIAQIFLSSQLKH